VAAVPTNKALIDLRLSIKIFYKLCNEVITVIN